MLTLVVELLYLVNALIEELAVLDKEDRQLDFAELVVTEDALDDTPFPLTPVALEPEVGPCNPPQPLRLVTDGPQVFGL